MTCADMVDKIDALRHERQYVMYNMMLQELLAVMRDEAMKDPDVPPRKEFSVNVLQKEVVRPWGRKVSAVKKVMCPLSSVFIPCHWY